MNLHNQEKTGNGVVGVDLGIKHLAIISDGEFFKNQKYLKQNLKKLKKEQRSLSRNFKKEKNKATTTESKG